MCINFFSGSMMISNFLKYYIIENYQEYKILEI